MIGTFLLYQVLPDFEIIACKMIVAYNYSDTSNCYIILVIWFPCYHDYNGTTFIFYLFVLLFITIVIIKYDRVQFTKYWKKCLLRP